MKNSADQGGCYSQRPKARSLNHDGLATSHERM